MKNKLFFFLVFLFLLNSYPAVGQSKQSKTLRQAHQKQLDKDDFIKTDEQHFLVSVYTNKDKSFTKRTHHWFLDLKDIEGNPIDSANVKLKGYLKANPEVKFYYLGPVLSLCADGKYLIGFVNLNQTGPWILEMEIDDKSIKDAFTHEITIPKRTRELAKNKE